MHYGIEELIDKDFENIKPDIIVNFAAETHVDRSIKDPEAFLRSDIMGLFNLVKLALKYKVKKFIHMSTDEVYGSIEDKVITSHGHGIIIRKENEADESFPLNPTSPYSASKASADLLLQAYHKTYGLPIVLIRSCNNYGPNQYPEKLIPMAITRLLQGKKILMHGEGEEVREWIYVEDCVNAIHKIMNEGFVGEIYNLGSGDRRTNKEVIYDIIGECCNFKTSNHIKKIENRPGNDKRYAINSNKLLDLYDGYRIRDSFIVGLQKTVEWYKENQGWWDNVNLDSNIYQSGVSVDYLR